MAYKIAVGSSDEINVDLKFGQVSEFLIYSVEGKSYELVEKRSVVTQGNVTENQTNSCARKGCSDSSNCSGSGHGCGGPSDVTDKVTAIADCRAVVCKKIGFQAQKQFERKTISVFDVECSVKDALEKISFYYDKIDNRKSLRPN